MQVRQQHVRLWGKKKPASTLSEAPAYKPSNPALPSAGQIPASIASTPGTSLSASATASTGTTTPSSAAAGGYSSHAGRLSANTVSDHAFRRDEGWRDRRCAANEFDGQRAAQQQSRCGFGIR